MSLINLVKSILNLQKKLDTKLLPSQGLFYKDDFEISIKKADIADIIEYEHNYVKDNLGMIIDKLKKLVYKNTTLSKGYEFGDIKSIDIIFIFFEIVKFTKSESIKLKYYDDERGVDDFIEFDSNHFNYFTINDKIMKKYDNINKEFIIEGYRYTLPAIGLENCLTMFLIEKSNKKGAEKYNDYNYNFTYFLSNKNSVTFSEIENLIQIFNFDMPDIDQDKITRILEMFLPIQNYSLIKGNKVIDINSKIDLEKIWK